MQVTIDGDDLVIRVPMDKQPGPSKSGKTLVVATSHGSYVSDLVLDECRIVVSLNAFINPKKKGR